MGLTQKAISLHLEEMPKTAKAIKSAFQGGKDIKETACDMGLDILVTIELRKLEKYRREGMGAIHGAEFVLRRFSDW